jgi:alcohol dehydrogenase, propanol-preferring
MDIPHTMTAMVLTGAKKPLEKQEVPLPQPGPDQVLIRVAACGVCRTDLHIVDGELTHPRLPLIVGHEIVGVVVKNGSAAKRFNVGDRVGVPWLGFTCGTCRYCRTDRENLCDNARFTGYTIQGGFAEFTAASERYCFAVPDEYPDVQAAPLLCAGLIGYRSYRMVPPEAETIGLYGFGAAGHIIAQIAVFQGKRVFAFTKKNDKKTQEFSLRLGAVWAGDSSQTPPAQLDAAIIFAPVGALVPAALGSCAKGGVVVCAGIHMTDIPSFPYRQLWGERCIRSVANLTRADGEELLSLAPRVPVKTEVTVFPLEQANEALDSVRNGTVDGAAVLKIH